MKKALKCIGFFLLIFALVSCGPSTGDPSKDSETETKPSETETQPLETETHEPLFADGIDNVQSISVYCMASNNPISVTDKETIAELMAFVTSANGTKGESTWGHYGVLYSLRIFTEDGSEPLDFWLWDEERYSLRTYEDEYGYPYFWIADMSEMRDYLEENFPEDFWITD